MGPVRELEAREKRTPVWAMLAPVLYLLTCGLAAREALQAHDDAGLYGMLAAIGLLPAFVIPAIFTTCKVRLSAIAGGLRIASALGTRVEKVDEARLDEGARGTGILHVTLRDGESGTFVVSSYREAKELLAALPPASAPAGALAV